VRYLFIKQQTGHFSIAALCRAMQVSQGGYFAWCKRAMSNRQQANQSLTDSIRVVYKENRKVYGSPRIYHDLKSQGLRCSEKRIARLMQLAGIRAQIRKRFVQTTTSDPNLPVAENKLAREFEVDTPNARWTSDITYLWTREGWLYLAVILDLFSRRVVGWATGQTLERSLVITALNAALSSRQPEAGLLCHSDRGSQYASHDYQTLLKEAGVECSMSRKGNCWDNAPTESFFASLKRELVYGTTFATRQEAHSALFDWIEVFYNRKRRHSALGYKSPVEFESLYQMQQIASTKEAVYRLITSL
jgi:putative transposase